MTWLAQTGLEATHHRLFPFLYPGKIPAAHTMPTFKGTRDLAKELNIKYVGPQSLRKTRVNWLLRRSRDPNITAEQAAHSRETLLRTYELPHHQAAVVEITRFHKSTDPTITPPGPGLCADNHRKPAPLPATPTDAPIPDCISPEGCLFCMHHRDVLSSDYCWKLASHAKLKSLELSLYKTPRANPIHPANLVIERINGKLSAISARDDTRARWVVDAQDAIRAGRYHPEWDGHIQLLEAFI